MPQASTSHVTHQPRVKDTPLCPPPVNKLYDAYLKANPDKVLRFGQYFFNNYLAGTIREIKYPYNLDKLYNSTNTVEILEIITQMYLDYEWPLR